VCPTVRESLCKCIQTKYNPNLDKTEIQCNPSSSTPSVIPTSQQGISSGLLWVLMPRRGTVRQPTRNTGPCTGTITCSKCKIIQGSRVNEADTLACERAKYNIIPAANEVLNAHLDATLNSSLRKHGNTE